jgi:hypothetical protein
MAYKDLENRRAAGRKASQRFRDIHGAESKKYQREWARNLSPEKKKLRAKKGNRRRYGLTIEKYDAKLASQNNLCALCHKPFNSKIERERPVLDHNHRTKVLRDFIHSQCNIGIGNLLDDAAICRLAAEYLERHKQEEA